MSAHRGFVLPLAIGMIVALAILGAIAYLQLRPKPSTQTNNQYIDTSYVSQEECEAKTGKTCGFAMCDVVPAGKTFEETCGKGFKAGWKPKPQSPTSTATSDTTNWKTYENEFYQSSKFAFKYPNTLTLTSGEKKGDAIYFDQGTTLSITSIEKPVKQSFKEFATLLAKDTIYLNGRGLMQQGSLKIDGQLAFKNYIEAENGRKEIQVLVMDPKEPISTDQAGVEAFNGAYNIVDVDTNVLPENEFDKILSTFKFTN